MKIETYNYKYGLGFWQILGLIFIVLKLCGIIDWNWIWVLCPLWIPFAIVLLVFILFVIAFTIDYFIGKR